MPAGILLIYHSFGIVLGGIAFFAGSITNEIGIKRFEMGTILGA